MNIRMIISPAKKMVTDNDWMAPEQLPCFLDRTEKIRRYLDKLSYEELKQLWGCSDKLARENEQRLRQMRLTEHLTPALLAYEGIQYQYMAPRVFTDADSLRILRRTAPHGRGSALPAGNAGEGPRGRRRGSL